MLGIMKPEESEHPKTLHTSNYDYNDNLLASGGCIFCIKNIFF